MPEYALPRDTDAAFQAGGAHSMNLGLLFDRYTPFGPGWTLEGRSKYDAFNAIVQAAAQAARDSNYRRLIRDHCRRWRATVRAAGAPADCIFTALPEWRFVVGLGRESVLETGFTFHRLYGFPYLPGSALKGLTQTRALWDTAERLGIPALLAGEERRERTPIQELEALLLAPEEAERIDHLNRLRASRMGIPATVPVITRAPDELLGELREDAKHYQAVFGTVRARGQVVFFDAVPLEPPVLSVDIMNPHYGEYYQQKRDVPPADYLSPVPVHFLAVESSSPFAFAVAAADDDLARRARDWLQAALGDLGVGGKTSSGYGYWGEIEAEASTVSPATPTDATPSRPGAPTSTAPEDWRSATVREYRPEKKQGTLVDDENGQKLRFRWEALIDKAWSPGSKARVEYVAVQQEGLTRVLKVRRRR